MNVVLHVIILIVLSVFVYFYFQSQYEMINLNEYTVWSSRLDAVVEKTLPFVNKAYNKTLDTKWQNILVLDVVSEIAPTDQLVFIHEKKVFILDGLVIRISTDLSAEKILHAFMEWGCYGQKITYNHMRKGKTIYSRVCNVELVVFNIPVHAPYKKYDETIYVQRRGVYTSAGKNYAYTVAPFWYEIYAGVDRFNSIQGITPPIKTNHVSTTIFSPSVTL